MLAQGARGPILPPSEWDWGGIGKEAGLGAVLGFAVGYAAKKAMKLVIVGVALILLLMVALETQGLIAIKWSALESAYSRAIQPETIAGVTGTVHGLVQKLERLIPVSGGFVAGCYFGFRKG